MTRRELLKALIALPFAAILPVAPPASLPPYLTDTTEWFLSKDPITLDDLLRPRFTKIFYQEYSLGFTITQELSEDDLYRVIGGNL